MMYRDERRAAAISAAVAVAALTSANATAIVGARTACALGQRIRPMRWLGQWDHRRVTPGNGLIAQGGVALNNVRVESDDATLDGAALAGGYAVLRRGKKTLAGLMIR